MAKGLTLLLFAIVISRMSPAQSTPPANVPPPIVPGGLVLLLYAPDSHVLDAKRMNEAENRVLNATVPGRVNSITNVHNPSIEFHPVDASLNNGTAVILIPGGGHRFLNVGSEGADFIPFFYNYGVNTVILRYRLRSDGYNPQIDAVRDAQEAIRLVRSHAAEWHLDPAKIGVMGFSAGGELAAFTAVTYPQFDRDHPGSVSSRPDFAGIIYPGPTPFASGRTPPPLPDDVPPQFIVCGGTGDKVHAAWAIQYFSALLDHDVPNIEMHIYGVGRHPGDPLPNGRHQSGGLTDRGNTPFGTWQFRFIDWFRNLGFLEPAAAPVAPTKLK